MSYNFRTWRDFFNDRQLLALGWLRRGIARVADEPARAALATLFSGVLEFNNLFASYKGEGTGAVRHMFSHHILKPERTPIEANVWGTPKSSGSFSNLFRGRLLRAIDYRLAPTEVGPGTTGKSRVCCTAVFGSDRGDLAVGRPVAGAGDLPVVRRLGRDRAAGPEHRPDRHRPAVLRQRPLLGTRRFLPRLAGTGAGFRAAAVSTRRPAEVQDPDAGSSPPSCGRLPRVPAHPRGRRPAGLHLPSFPR